MGIRLKADEGVEQTFVPGAIVTYFVLGTDERGLHKKMDRRVIFWVKKQVKSI